MSKTDSKKMSAAAWIMIQAQHKEEKGEAYEADVAHLIMGATAVGGKRTEAEWDALYSAALEAEVTMKEAAEFG